MDTNQKAVELMLCDFFEPQLHRHVAACIVSLDLHCIWLSPMRTTYAKAAGMQGNTALHVFNQILKIKV